MWCPLLEVGLVAQSTEVVAENSVDEALEVPLKEKKRHRDG